MQQMQTVFNLRMEPIRTHEEYPKYARSETKPVVRARHIIDQGEISANPCSICIDLDQDCYRWEGTFSKCAYCTSKDKKREFCHLPGQEASPLPEKRKRRKITANIYAPGGDAASTADTMMSGTLVSGTLASGTTLFPSVPRDVQPRAPSPVPASPTKGSINESPAAPPAASETGSNATLERVTALENQVSSLEAKVMELLVKLAEVSSCVSTSSTPRRQQAVAGASPTATNVSFEDLQAQRLSDAPRPLNLATATHLATKEWVEGPDHSDAAPPVQVTIRERVEEPTTLPTPEHSIAHADGYKPVNCSCGDPSSPKNDAVVPKEGDAGAETNEFSVNDMASRGNLF